MPMSERARAEEEWGEEDEGESEEAEAFIVVCDIINGKLTIGFRTNIILAMICSDSFGVKLSSLYYG